MSQVVKDVTIIGAGLGGTALAIGLHRQGVPVRIFEYRGDESDVISSGVLLHPNSLLMLDKLGILSRIEERCYKLHEMLYSDADGKPVTTQAMGAKVEWGYDIHRLYRILLLREMKAMLKEYGVPIVYNSKFERVVEETADGVTFAIAGRTEHTSFLVGADGIHSAVRHYLSANEPEYTGLLAAVTHIPTDTVAWPTPDYNKAVTFMGKNGGMYMVPEVPDASEIMVGIQIEHPDLGRSGWDELGHDHERMVELFARDYESWGAAPRSIVDSIRQHKSKIILWPMRKLPTLDSWASKQGRVVVIGDAAHTIPPSSGQGVNQAIEDVYTLSFLLGNAAAGTDLVEMLAFWRKWRLGRIDYILRNTAMTDAMRGAPETRARLEAEGKLKDIIMTPDQLTELLAKIYLPKPDEDMTSWLEEHAKGKTA